MLKVVLLALVLLWVARLIGRFVPRFEITVDRVPEDDAVADDVRVYAVMREHFPDRYEAFKAGLLSESEERRLFLDSIEILGAREEIERL